MTYPHMPDFRKLGDQITLYAHLEHEHGAQGIAPVLSKAEEALRAAIVRCAELESALGLHEELETVCRELGDGSGVRAAAQGQRRLLRKLGRGPQRPTTVTPGQLSLGL